jgi:DNA-binding SARP family transcriptional activator/class 3 adenylate cyclase
MAELPTGTVTLLFSDIEGSTRLLERLGQRYGEVLAQHRQLLRAAFRAQGAHEVEVQGDAFFVAFERAVDAVVAAAAAQRALAEHQWPDGAAPRVRMGLHTGEPTVTGGGYVGLDVHRAARLCALGHGGQVLLSRTTRDLVEDERPEGLSLRDLGEHRLKDLRRAEHVFQLVIAGLPADFPALDTAPAPSARNLSSGTRVAFEEQATAAISEPSPPDIQAYLLGGFRVVSRGHQVPDDAWRRRKARQLFKLLLTRSRRRLTKDEAMELLWPESDPEAAAINLRSVVHAIRRAFETSRLPGSADALIVDRDSIGLAPNLGIWVDADAFEQALAQAQHAADPLPLFQEANALYTGDYLPEDVYEEWTTERREALKRAWAGLQLDLAKRLEQEDDLEAAVTAYERLLQTDPCDERAAQELIRVHGQRGRRSDALRVYQRLVESLRADLAVEPSEKTVQLYRQAAAGEPLREEPPLPTPAARFTPSYPFPVPNQLVGRRIELARLERVLERGRKSGQAILVGAPAGTGKSTIVGALMERAQEAGVLCLAGGCYEEKGVVPLGPFQDALADYLLAQPPTRLRADLDGSTQDLARVVPELRQHLDLPEAPAPDFSASPASDRRAERIRLFGAVHACLRGLAEHGPVLLCLEDLHAADVATLELLHYLARQTRRLPLILLGTFRTEEAQTGQPLARLLVSLTRERLAERLRLAALDRDETSRLVTALLDGPASERLSQSLYETTEGNPLFLEQLVLALREEGRVDRRAGVWQQTGGERPGVPVIIREVIGRRLERLTESCLDTLNMAAVLGQTVAHEVLQAALQPRDESELLADLEEALGAQLLYETSNGYSFGHALLRQTVYWGLSGPRRMRLHARAGETLERLAGERAADQAAELAHHFGLAGDSPHLRAKVLRYSLEAGRRAAALSAHQEARAHFGKACELVEQNGLESDPAVQLAALEGRGYAERELAMWLPSVASFRRVLELTEEPLRRARARGAIGYALHHTVDIAAALAECDAGLAELASAPAGPEAAAARLRLQSSKALPLFVQGRFKEMLALGSDMLGVASELGQLTPLTWAHNTVGLSHMGQGHVEQALEHFELNLRAAERADDKVSMAIALENLGLQHYRAAQFGAARAHLERALAIYRDSATEQRAVLTIQALGRLWLAEGHLDQAREQAELGLALALEAHDRWAAECHDLLGAVQALRADWAAAQTSFERALEIREAVGHAAGVVDSLIGLGLVRQHRGDWASARASYTRAVEVASAMDPSPQLVASRRHLGQLLWLIGDQALAVDQIEQALSLARTIPRSIEYAPTLLAKLHWYRGSVAEAIELVQQSLVAGMTAELAVEARVLLAVLHVTSQRPDLAQPHIEDALHLAERMGAPRLLGLSHLAAGKLAWRNGDEAGATGSFGAAIQHLEAAATPYERAEALKDYAEVLEARGSFERARAMRDQALKLVEQLGARFAETTASS